jgi:hypothetical protein
MRNVDSKIKSPQFDRYVILIPQIVRGDFFDSIGQRRKGSQRAYPSGLLPRADIVDAFWHFRFVPILLQKSVDGFCEE